ncbi:MAG: hypothetical protein GY854_02270 [Deltaproteobacteria bacterium]|nr:hypothetical protein [Deltaproteobacteria bacterium]
MADIFPRGGISLGNGDLVDVTNIKLDTKNNSKQVHTIRRKGAGITPGNEDTTITFDAMISEFGEEADWLKAVKKGTIKQLRIKIPGRTIACNGVFTDFGIEIPLDDAIKLSMTFIGHVDD